MTPARYRLVVAGDLSPRSMEVFEEMTIEHRDGTTSIVGVVEDQAHLLGLLEQVGALGLTLLGVTREDSRP